MIFSHYQTAIFDAVINTNSNIAVNATAGSGKTTTIVEAANRFIKRYPYKSVLCTAFNKSIVEELKKRLKPNIDSQGIHSLGKQALTRYHKNSLFVDEYKTFKLADIVLKKVKFKKNEKFVYQYTLSDIIDLLRLTLVEPNFDNIDNLCNRYDISIMGDEINHSIELYNILEKHNRSLIGEKNTIDFTDMVFLPATNDKIQLKKYDVVIIDEAQDLNRVQHKFIDKLLKPNGRLISVGDKHQAIYGFAGADSNSFEILENRPNTLSLPLSVCYRCSRNIVFNAQQVNPEIEPSDDQITGPPIIYGEIEQIDSNSLVVSRNVRPLVNLFFKLLENNQKSFIKGRDIENGLIALYNKVKDYEKWDAEDKLNDKLDNLFYELKEKGIKKPKEHAKYLNLKEKVIIIKLIASKVKYMFEVENKIHQLFKDKKNAIQLMTVHKSKGLEADKVFFIESFNGDKLIPSKYAKHEEELKQENNLLFVALTRAKKELIYIKLIE